MEEQEQDWKRELWEKYGLKYDYEKFEDTSERFNDPAEWIAENTAQFIKLMLMSIPPELIFQAKEQKDTVKKVLGNIFEVSELILEGKMRYEEKEYVANFFEWLWEGVMSFLYGEGGLTMKDVVTKWKTEEIDAAKPRAVKFLLQDLEKQ